MTEPTPDPSPIATDPRADSYSPPSMLLLGADDTAGLAARLDERIAETEGAVADVPLDLDPPDDGPARLAIVGVTPRRLELARKILAQDMPWRGRNSVWFEPHGLLRNSGQLAFVFPGVEPDFEPRIDDVARHFGLEALATGSHDDTAVEMPHLERQARGIIAVSRVLDGALGQLGIVPDMAAGHSIGEWSAKLATGVVAGDHADELIAQIRPGTANVADVAYLALGCGIEKARELAAGLGQTVVSHDNCPQQSVLCGPPGEIEVATERCRTAHVLAQELPFRSGFHSPLYAPPKPSIRFAFESLPLKTPAIPLWSATTCQPFPSDPRDIWDLAWRHLVEPVRFRELVIALHDAGTRVFVQVGVGHITAFVENTLKDRDAIVVAANSPKRSGLDQLCQVAAAVWVAGRDVALDRLAGPPRQTGDPRQEPEQHVRATAPPPATSDVLTWERRFSLDVEPAWADHALYRQAEQWPYPEDRFPLVPMAGILEILMESASKLHPDQVPVAIEDVAAFRYLVVAPPTTATMRAATEATAADGPARVKIGIDRHARATVVLAPMYPAAPSPSSTSPLVGDRPNPIDADLLYEDRYMFHGPAYQGVDEILALAENGSRAILCTPAAPGALLDNVAQLTGHWLATHADTGRVVLPTSIERVELFGPHPPPGTLVDCTITITDLDRQALRADATLVVDDRLWCRITGWENRRFDIDAGAFDVLRWPERTTISTRRNGYTLVSEQWPDSASRDVIMRRYLGRDERREYNGHNPLSQRRFLLGRIAVKDAVRQWLWATGHGPLFPAEIVVADGRAGRPLVRGPYPADLRVSYAHVEGSGVAIVTEGTDVGIDIEKIEPRRSDFEQVVLTPREQALEPPDGYDRDAWLTSLWAVKEAAAKATGRGLQGRPQDFEVTECRADEDEHRCCVGDRWVGFELVGEPTAASIQTARKECIVAWTLTDH